MLVPTGFAGVCYMTILIFRLPDPLLGAKICISSGTAGTPLDAVAMVHPAYDR